MVFTNHSGLDIGMLKTQERRKDCFEGGCSEISSTGQISLFLPHFVHQIAVAVGSIPSSRFETVQQRLRDYAAIIFFFRIFDRFGGHEFLERL
jgi:hypothetical protein